MSVIDFSPLVLSSLSAPSPFVRRPCQQITLIIFHYFQLYSCYYTHGTAIFHIFLYARCMHALFLFGRLSLLNGFLAEQLELLRARCSRGIVCHVRARPVTVLLFRQKQQRNYWITLVPTHNGALIFHYFIWPKKNISKISCGFARDSLTSGHYFGGSTANTVRKWTHHFIAYLKYVSIENFLLIIVLHFFAFFTLHQFTTVAMFQCSNACATCFGIINYIRFVHHLLAYISALNVVWVKLELVFALCRVLQLQQYSIFHTDT